MASLLLIDDDQLFREILAAALTESGYTVTQAEDGEQGLTLFRAAPVDLVLTDIVMPHKDGIATVVELRRDYPRLGIIVMAGGVDYNAPLYLNIAGAFGANRMIKKPFDFPTLFTAIEEVLAASGEGKPDAP